MMRKYCGRRDGNGCVVFVVEHDGDSRILPLRLDLWNHSPTGFEWGYGGSGPAQLALALLADALGNDFIAKRLHQAFKWKYIAKLPHDGGWQMTETQVLEAVAALLAPLAASGPR